MMVLNITIVTRLMKLITMIDDCPWFVIYYLQVMDHTLFLTIHQLLLQGRHYFAVTLLIIAIGSGVVRLLLSV